MNNSMFDFIDLGKVDTLLEGFTRLTGVAVALIDVQGKVLLDCGWKHICVNYHRANPESAKRCTASNKSISQKLETGQQYHMQMCMNGLTYAAVPLVIQGEHVANIFVSQFLMEQPDILYFKNQALEYGFDMHSYLQALEDVPIVTPMKVKSAIDHVLNLTQIISDIVMQNIRLLNLNKTIQESEEKHCRLFETMTQGVIYQSAEGSIISVNPAAERILGLTLEQMQRKTSMDTSWRMITEDGTPVPDDEQPAMTAIRTGETIGPVIMGVLFQGKEMYVWLNITSVPLFHLNHSEPYQVYTTIEDITDRKYAEEKLKQVLNEYETVFQGTQDAMFLVQVSDATTFRYIRNNKVHEKRTGITAEQLNNKTPQELLGDELWEIIAAHYLRCVHDAIPVSYEETLDLPDGRRTWHTTLSPISDNGEIVYIVGSSKDITEQKQAEEEISRFKTVSENAAYGQVITDIHGVITFINRFFAEIHGYSPDELIGSHLSIFHTPEQEQKVNSLIASLLKEGSFNAAEVWHVHRDGTEFPMLMSGIVLQDGHGNIQYMAASSVDMRAYHLMQQNYQLMFDIMQSGFALHEIICNDEGAPIDYRFLSINTAFGAMTGLQAENIIGRRVMKVLPDTEQFLIDTYGKVALTGEPVSFEHYANQFDKYFGVTAFRPAEGQFACIFQDITERKFSEQVTQIRIQLLEYAQGHSLDDLLQKILEKAEMLSGSCISFFHFVEEDQKTISVHTWSSRTQLEFCNSDCGDKHCFLDEAGVWSDCVWDKKPVIHNDYASLPHQKGLPEGHTPIIRELVVPVLRGDSIVGILGVGNKPDDYTNSDKETISYLVDMIWEVIEHKRSEEQLKEMQIQFTQMQKMETVGRLAGGIAHDFNNMLGVILGRAELGLEQVHPNQAVHDDLLEIRKAAARSAELTAQLLAFARKQAISPKVLNLNDVVSDMISMLHRLIGEDIDLLWFPGHDIWSVHIDLSQVHQILINLCVNSRNAILGVGVITIETKNTMLENEYCDIHEQLVPGEYVVLSVSDDGCGMDEKVLPKIFEPFFTTSEVGKGTGMGLATVHGIVKQNMGCINVYSEEGQGTTVNVYLPKYNKKARQKNDENPQNNIESGEGTILLVDDNLAVLAMTRKMLEKLGYTVLEAKTPKKAIHIAEICNHDIDLLITDMVMPEMSGRDLADAVMPMQSGMKVLFMSGYTDKEIIRQDCQDSMVSFLQKPFSTSELSIKIQELLSVKQLTG